MTTFDTEQPYFGDHEDRPQKTSGMAITALVLSIAGIIPCCGLVTAGIGAVMGIVGVVTIGSDPTVKGRGMSAAAIVIGVVLIIVQLSLGMWVGRMFYGPIVEGPRTALAAGFAGDYNGFRDAFHGPGATATDEEIEAFIAELRSRYGEFVSSELIGDPAAVPGAPVLTGEYRLTFSNAVVDAEAEIIIVDEDTGEIFIFDLGYIRILDPALGDIEFPPTGQP